MTRGKHVKSNKLIIPRGEVKPMTGIVTEEPSKLNIVNKHATAIAQLRKELNNEVKRARYFNEETRCVTKDRCDKMSDRLDYQAKQIKHLNTMVLVIVLYLLAWIVGWGMGAW